MVPDSCRETERNGNNVSADVTDDTIETIRTTLVSNNLAVVFNLFILQDKHNIRSFSLNIKLICTRCETGEKNLSTAHFSTCY